MGERSLPLIDDELAPVTPSGFDLPSIAASTLLLHGDRDGITPISASR